MNTEKTMDNNAYLPDSRPLWQRFLWRLFPTRTLPIPENLDGWAPSYMMTTTVVCLDWLDRLRMLVSGRLEVTVRTKTNVIVQRMLSDSAAFVLPPGDLR